MELNFHHTFLKKFCKENAIEHIFSPPYHPQSNGQAERFVDTLKRALRKLKGEGPMQEILDIFLVTYRTTPSATLQNRSPAELFLGRKPRTPLDFLKAPTQEVLERDTKMERQYNLKHGARHRQFAPGDLVFARHHCSQPWKEASVIDRRGLIIQVSHEDQSLSKYHVNQVRPRFTDSPKRNSVDPLAVLSQAFSIPFSAPGSSQNMAELAETSAMSAPESNTQLRRSTRLSRPTHLLQIQPREREFIAHQPKGL